MDRNLVDSAHIGKEIRSFRARVYRLTSVESAAVTASMKIFHGGWKDFYRDRFFHGDMMYFHDSGKLLLRFQQAAGKARFQLERHPIQQQAIGIANWLPVFHAFSSNQINQGWRMSGPTEHSPPKQPKKRSPVD